MMFQAQQMCEKNWSIKTLNGQFLSVMKGQVGLIEDAVLNNIKWAFKPASDIGRFYIEHVDSGERLVDVVNGGYDSWSLEPGFDGSFAFVSQGGLFRHFDYRFDEHNKQSIVETDFAYPKKPVLDPVLNKEVSYCDLCKKRLAEYYHWVIE
ncbi:hypothetical protein [Catenovulum adriaticum]|uniref:Uncharacterized protein n=1 Tax=Catenovulum adriaticum TaxID=2984846 RepID=A0ABY7AJD7_9ALTE|nr:hypothetical protein [Catenovulum sp. TS8]WAJ69347.1 hypothetical protein OLW01_09130 [Catenovulum sp. TS8]